MTNEITAKAFWAAVQSPLLSGAGEGNGIADISLQRDSISGFPKIDGSVWKGAVAKMLPFTLAGDKHLSFSDLRLLFFPVQSGIDLYTLITCPSCLDRFIRDMVWYGILSPDYENYMDQPGYFPEAGKMKKWKASENFDVLLDVPYEIRELEKEILVNPFEILGFDEDILERAGLVTDEEFFHFVRYETELMARIYVEKGNLFTEEYLPEKTILYGVANEFRDLLHPLKTPILLQMSKYLLRAGNKGNNSFVLQIGKNRTLGKGRIHFHEIIPENIRGERNG